MTAATDDEQWGPFGSLYRHRRRRALDNLRFDVKIWVRLADLLDSLLHDLLGVVCWVVVRHDRHGVAVDLWPLPRRDRLDFGSGQRRLLRCPFKRSDGRVRPVNADNNPLSSAGCISHQWGLRSSVWAFEDYAGGGQQAHENRANRRLQRHTLDCHPATALVARPQVVQARRLREIARQREMRKVLIDPGGDYVVWSTKALYHTARCVRPARRGVFASVESNGPHLPSAPPALGAGRERDSRGHD